MSSKYFCTVQNVRGTVAAAGGSVHLFFIGESAQADIKTKVGKKNGNFIMRPCCPLRIALVCTCHFPLTAIRPGIKGEVWFATKNTPKGDWNKAKKEKPSTQPKSESDALGPLSYIHKPNGFSAVAPGSLPPHTWQSWQSPRRAATVSLILEGWVTRWEPDTLVAASRRSLRQRGPLHCYKM